MPLRIMDASPEETCIQHLHTVSCNDRRWLAGCLSSSLASIPRGWSVMGSVLLSLEGSSDSYSTDPGSHDLEINFSTRDKK